MENYIKYKRFSEIFILESQDFQEFLDKLIIEGWQIISYNEVLITHTNHRVTILAGKKQDDQLKYI